MIFKETARTHLFFQLSTEDIKYFEDHNLLPKEAMETLKTLPQWRCVYYESLKNPDRADEWDKFRVYPSHHAHREEGGKHFYELIKQYGSLYKSFEQISENNELIKKFNMDAKLEETILHIINERIKPEEIFIKAEIKLQSMTSDGIDKIKEMLIKVKNDNITISYISAPKYNALIKAKDYKQGEAMLKEITETLTKEAKKSNCVFEIDKI